MASARPSVLTNRAALSFALAFSVYQALPRWMTTFSGLRPAAQGSDPLFLVWTAFAAFIAASIAIRSGFPGDRVVFGVATASFVLQFVRRITAPSRPVDIFLGGLISLAWAGAAFTCLVLLFRKSDQRRD